MDNRQQTQDTRVVLTIVLFVIGLFLIASGGGIAWMMIESKPKAKRRPPASLVPAVQVAELKSKDVTVQVHVMGVVVAAEEVTLRARVSGEITKLHQDLEPGGILKKGEPIIWLDESDYKLQLEMKQAALEKAKSQLQLELAQQRIAENQYKRFTESNKRAEADLELVLRKPQERSSRADVAAAEADIKKAQLELSRTVIKCPFNAIVLEETADVGEQADLQRILVNLMGVDSCWVQASVPVKSLKWMTFPENGKPGSKVTIKSRRGNRKGQVLRLMGSLDTKGRMALVLIEVKDPLALKPENKGKVPLLLGEYVDVAIQGSKLRDVVEVPREAYREDRDLWLLTPESKLAVVRTEPVWDTRNSIYVAKGDLPKGKLIVSNLGFPVKGMSLVDAAAPATEPKKVQDKNKPNK